MKKIIILSMLLASQGLCFGAEAAAAYAVEDPFTAGFMVPSLESQCALFFSSELMSIESLSAYLAIFKGRGTSLLEACVIPAKKFEPQLDLLLFPILLETVDFIIPDKATITKIKWDPNNDRIALIGKPNDHQNILYILDATTGEFLQKICPPSNFFGDFEWSPDGLQIASMQENLFSKNTLVTIWNSRTGERIKALDCGNAPCALAWHPTEPLLAVALRIDAERPTDPYAYCIRIFNIETDTCIQEFHGHTNFIYSLAWNSTGSFIASGSADRTAKIWNCKNAECLATYSRPAETLPERAGHEKSVYHLSWSPDDKAIAVTYGHKDTFIWNIALKESTLLEDSIRVEWLWNSVCIPSISEDGKISIWSSKNPGTPLLTRPAPRYEVLDPWRRPTTTTRRASSSAWNNEAMQVASGDHHGTIQIQRNPYAEKLDVTQQLFLLKIFLFGKVRFDEVETLRPIYESLPVELKKRVDKEIHLFSFKRPRSHSI
jgi:WD40 repeat protein